MKTKILDCTIRDGGYLNDWKFSKRFVKDYYTEISKTGIDITEIGFRSSYKYFNSSIMGIWRFTPESIINEIANGVNGIPISLMVDYGKTDLFDIPDASKSIIKHYRVAAHKNKILDAIGMANDIADKGYKVSIQLMGIVKYSDSDFRIIIPSLKDSDLTYVYFADSYGSLFPYDINRILSMLRETDKLIGFHPHNNIQLAFANALEAIRCNIDIIDSSIYGSGRGGGNLPTELLLLYLEKKYNEYQVDPILQLIDKYFITNTQKLKIDSGHSYMISGINQIHPNYIGDMILSEHTTKEISKISKKINKINPIGFDRKVSAKTIL